MAEVVKGIVENIYGPSEKGFFTVRIAGDNYGAGKFAPKFNASDEVQFEYTMNGDYRNMEFKTVTVISKGTGEAAVSSTPVAATAATATPQKGTNWDAKDKRISFLASRKDAIEIARLAIDKDALPLPTKKADRLGVLLGFVNDTTQELYSAIYGENFEGE